MQNRRLYEKYKEGMHWENHPIVYAKRFARFLKKHDVKGLLVDVGCGSGKNANVFQKQQINVLGIDSSKEEVKTAKANYPTNRFEQQNVENLNLAENSVAAFFAINIIHYTKQEKALKEIHRTLKKNGYLFIHFNLSIKNPEGKLDFKQDEWQILQLVKNFKLLEKRKITRIDQTPVEHKHEILELILQK